MPIEFMVLKDQPSPLEKCPRCGVEPFEPFLRGMIQRRKWDLINLCIRPYCTLICTTCKEIVGHEHPITGEITISRPHLWSKLGGILRDILRCF
jgi:hypothetical protein